MNWTRYFAGLLALVFVASATHAQQVVKKAADSNSFSAANFLPNEDLFPISDENIVVSWEGGFLSVFVVGEDGNTTYFNVEQGVSKTGALSYIAWPEGDDSGDIAFIKGDIWVDGPGLDKIVMDFTLRYLDESVSARRLTRYHGDEGSGNRPGGDGDEEFFSWIIIEAEICDCDHVGDLTTCEERRMCDVVTSCYQGLPNKCILKKPTPPIVIRRP